jgi:hypothetical protein
VQGAYFQLLSYPSVFYRTSKRITLGKESSLTPVFKLGVRMSMNQSLSGFSPSLIALALVVVNGYMIIADRQCIAFSYIVGKEEKIRF